MWRVARVQMWVKDGRTTVKRLRPLVQPADRLSTDPKEYSEIGKYKNRNCGTLFEWFSLKSCQ